MKIIIERENSSFLSSPIRKEAEELEDLERK